jgi:hypothetical protein
MMLYELDEIELAVLDGKVPPPTACAHPTRRFVESREISPGTLFLECQDCGSCRPVARPLKLRKADEPLTPWYARGIADEVRLRELEEGPATCASCGIGTWLEIFGFGNCHECIQMLRFAGCPAGTREEAYRVR